MGIPVDTWRGLLWLVLDAAAVGIGLRFGIAVIAAVSSEILRRLRVKNQ